MKIDYSFNLLLNLVMISIILNAKLNTYQMDEFMNGCVYQYEESCLCQANVVKDGIDQSTVLISRLRQC